jgi:hypothetical protein
VVAVKFIWKSCPSDDDGIVHASRDWHFTPQACGVLNERRRPEHVRAGDPQVFEHVGALLASAQSMPGIFREQALLDELPQWIELCRWISERRSALSQAPALALLDRKPQHDHDHPLLRQGVSRHGMVPATELEKSSKDSNSPHNFQLSWRSSRKARKPTLPRSHPPA